MNILKSLYNVMIWVMNMALNHINATMIVGACILFAIAGAMVNAVLPVILAGIAGSVLTVSFMKQFEPLKVQLKYAELKSAEPTDVVVPCDRKQDEEPVVTESAVEETAPKSEESAEENLQGTSIPEEVVENGKENSVVNNAVEETSHEEDSSVNSINNTDSEENVDSGISSWGRKSESDSEDLA